MKRIMILTTLFFLFLSNIVVFAHPGRLDSKGGHWNHSTGTYHYHDGSSADKYTYTPSSDANESIYKKIISKDNKTEKEKIDTEENKEIEYKDDSVETSDNFSSNYEKNVYDDSTDDYMTLSAQLNKTLYLDASKEETLEMSATARIISNIFILLGVFYYTHIVGLLIKSIIEEKTIFKRISDSLIYSIVKSFLGAVLFPVSVITAIDEIISSKTHKMINKIFADHLSVSVDYTHHTLYLTIALLLPLYQVLVYQQNANTTFSLFYMMHCSFGRLFLSALIAYSFTVASITLKHDSRCFYAIGILFIILGFVFLFVPFAIMFIMLGAKTPEFKYHRHNSSPIASKERTD